MLKALGIVALVVLTLAGALMPLKYTARLGLPRKRSESPPDGARAREAESTRQGPE